MRSCCFEFLLPIKDVRRGHANAPELEKAILTFPKVSVSQRTRLNFAPDHDFKREASVAKYQH